jgi:monofunctional biosynthetic peptidoglycan transglycosylase
MIKKSIYLALLGGLLLAALYVAAFPDIAVLKKTNPSKTSFMKFREAEWRASGQKKKVRQVWIPLSGISPYLVKGVIIAEDDKFWSHEGFDYEAIQEAIEKDLKSKKYKKGGSTISQQLVKNLYLSPEKSLLRKLREAVITWKLERTLSKRRILEIYLNVVEWGDGLYGVESASFYYFGKPASQVTPMEASRLVSVLPNPRKFKADGNQRYVLNRSEMIYQIMVKRGIVVPEYEEVAREEASHDEVLTNPPLTAMPPADFPLATAPEPVLVPPSTSPPDDIH